MEMMMSEASSSPAGSSTTGRPSARALSAVRFQTFTSCPSPARRCAIAWQRMISEHPEVGSGSSGKYQNWEVVDPEKWVPQGYACLRIDSRGAGRSPGRIEHFAPRETQDLYQSIEWAGVQAWSSGK